MSKVELIDRRALTFGENPKKKLYVDLLLGLEAQVYFGLPTIRITREDGSQEAIIVHIFEFFYHFRDVFCSRSEIQEYVRAIEAGENSHQLEILWAMRSLGIPMIKIYSFFSNWLLSDSFIEFMRKAFGNYSAYGLIDGITVSMPHRFGRDVVAELGFGVIWEKACRWLAHGISGGLEKEFPGWMAEVRSNLEKPKDDWERGRIGLGILMEIDPWAMEEPKSDKFDMEHHEFMNFLRSYQSLRQDPVKEILDGYRWFVAPQLFKNIEDMQEFFDSESDGGEEDEIDCWNPKSSDFVHPVPEQKEAHLFDILHLDDRTIEQVLDGTKSLSETLEEAILDKALAWFDPLRVYLLYAGLVEENSDMPAFEARPAAPRSRGRSRGLASQPRSLAEALAFLETVQSGWMDSDAIDEHLIWIRNDLGGRLGAGELQAITAGVNGFSRRLKAYLGSGNLRCLRELQQRLGEVRASALQEGPAPEPVKAVLEPEPEWTVETTVEPQDWNPGVDQPGRRAVTENRVQRSPQVREWVLAQAKGHCESCGSSSFRNLGGEAYLEVHHPIQLAQGGPDRVENAVALCPACHRRMHLGLDREVFLESLYGRVPRLIRRFGT